MHSVSAQLFSALPGCPFALDMPQTTSYVSADIYNYHTAHLVGSRHVG